MKEMKGDRTEILDCFIGLPVWAVCTYVSITTLREYTDFFCMGDCVTTNHSLVYVCRIVKN